MTVELPISMLYAGLLALLYFVLAALVIRLRWRDRVGIGTGESKDLEVAVRIHGNFAEYVPFLLLLLVLMELSGASGMLLHTVGGLLFVARVCHAIGLRMSIGPSWARTVGVLGTFIVLLVQAGYMLGYAMGMLA
ncbi:MAPEG family protein [Pseudidiomarina terrestris]|uniref:MAPEG family protein n=1 Tax=Pseudidiomarina terrestris TaxID=2820060 RepID=A0AAW7QX53_9GAMM|nr:MULTISPECIES: MAPEG family protein [unclassified Pseudidiomarina]MDN7123405.1 MAPEG family protein [Pseudidiomarina sp. 1APP75-32.1]MDN7127763.1 MAPEG family protein [Pseudidiomarina sp. 1APR75-33.1]MDN7128870.1 MAPEG family protein [Pseudidiomarina sp. 1APR75-15]MDN7134867.1 MAPEG family protein [Pseudidiomarina sp. 1ASP75-5]MDN7137545.1 MAPEG family protein [Pseudidiomarina sp. 1ASP75-14]